VDFCDILQSFTLAKTVGTVSGGALDPISNKPSSTQFQSRVRPALNAKFHNRGVKSSGLMSWPSVKSTSYTISTFLCRDMLNASYTWRKRRKSVIYVTTVDTQFTCANNVVCACTHVGTVWTVHYKHQHLTSQNKTIHLEKEEGPFFDNHGVQLQVRTPNECCLNGGKCSKTLHIPLSAAHERTFDLNNTSAESGSTAW
jgi:hypothetical protein